MSSEDKKLEKSSLLGEIGQNQSRFSQQIAYNTFQQHLIQNTSKKNGDEYTDTFLRKTNKYWVLPSHFLTVKKRVSKQIPEWRFDNKVSGHLSQSGSVINSVYFDTLNLDLYDYRILQEEDSMLFRYRWYNNEKPAKGYFEQKLRQPAWRSLPSVKQRFQLAPNLVVPYLEQGKNVIQQPTPLMESIFNDMRKWPSQLKPSIRSTYRRTVFQESNGAAVRISFDEDITLTDVKNLSWEEACDPLLPMPGHKVFLFPLAVLEVKLAFESEEEVKELAMPDWVIEMQQSGLIIEVEKFSKFCTGAAVMNLHTIRRVPSWIAAVKTMLEIELASKSKDWFGMEKRDKNGGVGVGDDDDDEDVALKKKTIVPEKIEPREYLSNERTLLKWVRMCFLALFVGLALLSFQHEPVTGILLTSFSLGVLVRAYFMYYRRLKMLETKNYNAYFYDPWGPTMIIILFVVPAITYFLYCLGVLRVAK